MSDTENKKTTVDTDVANTDIINTEVINRDNHDVANNTSEDTCTVVPQRKQNKAKLESG